MDASPAPVHCRSPSCPCCPSWDSLNLLKCDVSCPQIALRHPARPCPLMASRSCVKLRRLPVLSVLQSLSTSCVNQCWLLVLSVLLCVTPHKLCVSRHSLFEWCAGCVSCPGFCSCPDLTIPHPCGLSCWYYSSRSMLSQMLRPHLLPSVAE